MKNFGFKSVIVPVLLSGLLLVSSCKKHDDSTVYGGSSTSTTANNQSRIKDFIKHMPKLKIGDPVGRYGILKFKPTDLANAKGGTNTLDNGWNFSTPSNGWSFSSPAGVGYSQANNTIYISGSSFGGSTGGTVVAGESSLDINYTFCFSANEQALGLNLFSGTTFSGVSVVVGISGDFSALQNATTNDNLTDFFHGLAFYVVYDSPASGSYDVISWFDGFTDPNFLDKKCFAFVFDFVKGKLYMSESGQMSVNGGTMGFNGQYLEISFDYTSANWNDFNYSTVSGFGTMGCN